MVRRIKNDGHMLYINGEHYVRQSTEDGYFYHCDQEGIKKGEDLEHVGDSYPTLDEAIHSCDFFATSGHWQDWKPFQLLSI